MAGMIENPDEKGSEEVAAKTAASGRPSLPANVKAIVWARAAGRCQFRGCNKPLIGDLVSGRSNLNTAYIAHIVSDAVNGPRGDKILSPLLTKDPSNLMLLCDAHHRLIDDRTSWKDYSVELLQEMKAEHEDRIEAVTSISRDRGCHVIRLLRGSARTSPR